MSDDPLSSGSAAQAATVDGAMPLSLPDDTQVAACMERWLRASTNAHSADTRLFAKLIAARDVRDELALLGLQSRDWNALLARHFAGASGSLDSDVRSACATARDEHPVTPIAATGPIRVDNDHTDFLLSLHGLLLDYASADVDTDDARDLATIITYACLRPDHLWRDLGLAGRDEVTWMLTRYFPALVALNVDKLRWKRFLAAQLALSMGLPPGPAPGCPGCEDFGFCFPLVR